MNLYNQVKILFEISDIAMNVFVSLKHSIQYGNSKEELYIYNTINELEFDFRDILNKYNKSIVKADKKIKTIQLKNGTIIRLKTIDECTRGLDGYRVGKIKFR